MYVRERTTRRKRCPACGASKPFDAFHRNRSRSDGRAIYCKECINRDRRERYARDPESFLAVTRRSRAKAPERHRQATKDWYNRVKRPLVEARAKERKALELRRLEDLRAARRQLCNRCKETKGLEEFYAVPVERRRSGFDGYCKQCRKEMSLRDYYANQERRKQTRRQYRQAHLEQERDRDRARSGSQKRLEGARRWRERNAHRLRVNQVKSTMRMLTDEAARKKQIVRTMTHLMILEGKIVRPATCAVCSQPGELVVHHRGYDGPDAATDIDWVHRGRCHGSLDKGRRDRERAESRQKGINASSL